MAADVRSILAKTRNFEAELAILTQNPEERRDADKFCKEVAGVRDKIRSHYEEIILTDLNFALSEEVDAMMWNSICYSQIEDFRKKAKKYRKDPVKLSQMNVCFCNFLADTSTYYEHLYQRVQDTYAHIQDDEKAGVETEAQKVSCLLQKVITCLGDLARYASMYNDGHKKGDWTQATRYYSKALLLYPPSGNAHNQLAVLATYQDNDFEAMYHYFRALATVRPFSSATVNLVPVFEKNRKRYLADLEEAKTNMHDENDMLRVFKTGFTRAHGILYAKTDCESFDRVCQRMFEQLAALVITGGINEHLVLQMSLINIFAFENMRSPHCSRATVDSTQQQMLQAMAHDMVVRTVTTIVDNSNMFNINEILGPLSVTLQWSTRHPSIFNQPRSKHPLRSICNLVNELVPRLEDKKDCNASWRLQEDIETLGFIYSSENTGYANVNGKTEADAAIALQERLRRIQTAVDWLVKANLLCYDPGNGTYFAPVQSDVPDESNVDRHEASRETPKVVQAMNASGNSFTHDSSSMEEPLEDFIDGEEIVFQGAF